MLAQVVLRRPLDLLVLASPRCLLDLRSQLADRPLGHPLRNAERRSEEHTSELQSRFELVWRLLLEKKKTQRVEPPARPRRRSGRGGVHFGPCNGSFLASISPRSPWRWPPASAPGQPHGSRTPPLLW